MKKRYLYALLFGIPGFFISLIISFIIFGAAAGLLWIFVFGDKPWPSSINVILPIAFAFIFLTAWVTSLIIGFATGKRIEKEQPLNKKHILASVGITALPILLIILHQLNVGNIGPKSESERCADFCKQKGYSTSSVSARNSIERTCTCLDSSAGCEIIEIPIAEIAQTQIKK